MPLDAEEPTALPRQKSDIDEVLVITHEAQKLEDPDFFLSRKLHPLVPLFISYKMEPFCEPEDTLYDCWKDRFVLKPSTDQNLLNNLALQGMFVSIDLDLRTYRRSHCPSRNKACCSVVSLGDFQPVPVLVNRFFGENHTSWLSYGTYSKI